MICDHALSSLFYECKDVRIKTWQPGYYVTVDGTGRATMVYPDGSRHDYVITEDNYQADWEVYKP